MSTKTPSTPSRRPRKSSSSSGSSASPRRGPAGQEPSPDANALLIIKLIEEGVSLAPLARASGIDIEELAALPVKRRSVVATAEELSQFAAEVAYRVLEEGQRLLDEGNETIRLRMVTSLAGLPLRRMATDQSKQLNAMHGLLDTILLGADPEDDEEDDTEEDNDDDSGTA
jgi:hypothetical protein